FFIPRLMPGNAVQSIMSKFPNLQPSAYQALEAMLGVGHPGSIWHQYTAYVVDVFHFNFGTDVSQYPAQVSTLLGESIPWTLTLVGMATVIAFLIGTALGIAAGWRHGGSLDRVLPGLMFLQAIPYFFFALILMELVVHQQRRLPLAAPGAHHRPHLDRRLDAADAQRHDHHDRRGLRDRGPGQGPAQPPGHLHLRGPQRDPAPAAGVRPRDRLRRVRR